jgi:tetratricopeptide (TPR) repeat protein
MLPFHLSRLTVFATLFSLFYGTTFVTSSGLVGPGGMVPHSGGGGRRRHGGYVRVQDPAVGFFISGSSIKAMNGLYRRINRVRKATIHNEFHLAYEHLRNNWMMALVKGPNDDYTPVGGEESEWVIVDPYGTDQFGHKGNSYIPGSGTRWQHVKRRSPLGGPPTDEMKMSLASDYENDLEQLPWQVIAILDESMFEKLRRQDAYHFHQIQHALNDGFPESKKQEMRSPQREEMGEYHQSESHKAEDAFEKENYEVAIEYYRRVIETHYDHITTDPAMNDWGITLHLTNMAASYRKLRKFDEAKKTMVQALRIKPNFVDAHFQIGVTLLDCGMYNDALHHFELVLKLDRDFSGLDRMLLLAAAAKERKRRAEEEAEKSSSVEDGETAYCIAWRQTGNCDGHAGEREPGFDRSCTDKIPYGVSGYCECRPSHSGHPVLDSFTKASVSTCDHQEFTCADKCLEEWEQRIANHAAEGSTLDETKRLISLKEQSGMQKLETSRLLQARREAKRQEKWRTAGHYLLLEAFVDFTPEELKKAYRRMSIKYHPDKNGGSNAAFQAVAEAYQTLSDKKRREEYDTGKDLDPPEDSNRWPFKVDTERGYFPERYEFHPFGNPHEDKTELHAERERRKIEQLGKTTEYSAPNIDL